MIKIISLFTIVALVSANIELDALENIGRGIVTSFHPEIGGAQGPSQSLFSSVVGGQSAKSALEQQNVSHVEEGVGSSGLTIVSVTKGGKQVNVTVQYGLGVGVVANARDTPANQTQNKDADQPSQSDLAKLVNPIYKNFVNDVANRETKGNETRVVLGNQASTNFTMRINNKEDIRARIAVGYQVAAHVNVTRRG